VKFCVNFTRKPS